MIKRYWSCSKFADWLRGTHEPKSETESGWAKWRTIAKTSNPICYWLAEEGLDILQTTIFYIPNKFYDFRCYLDNRFISKSHALVAHKNHLKRGQWHDVSGIILPCLFDTLVDFVEIELASEIFWYNENYKIPFIYKLPFMHWRSREAGIENLKWQMSLICDENCGVDKTDKLYGTPTEQSIRAKEIHDLYIWWKDVYTNRPEPMEISGWSSYCHEKRKIAAEKTTDKQHTMLSVFDDSELSKELKTKGNKAIKLLSKIEAQYEKEDTNMMIRLIKIRSSLWT